LLFILILSIYYFYIIYVIIENIFVRSWIEYNDIGFSQYLEYISKLITSWTYQSHWLMSEAWNLWDHKSNPIIRWKRSWCQSFKIMKNLLYFWFGTMSAEIIINLVIWVRMKRIWKRDKKKKWPHQNIRTNWLKTLFFTKPNDKGY